MAGFMKNAMSYLGMSDVVDDEDDYIEEDEEQKPASKSAFDSDHTVTPLASTTAPAASSTTKPFPGGRVNRITTIHPKSYEDAQLVSMLSLVFSLIGRILAWLINAYITVLFVRMILDWVSVLARNWYPRGVVAQLINIVYSITEPPLRWLRRYIRPLPLGSIYLDVSFIVLYFALVVLESVVLIVF